MYRKVRKMDVTIEIYMLPFNQLEPVNYLVQPESYLLFI